MKKMCSKCGKEMDFSCFSKGGGRFGLQSACKFCNKLYRDANKELIALTQRNWYLANKDKALNDCKQYRIVNRETIIEKKRNYNKVNRKSMNNSSKAHDASNAKYEVYRHKLTVSEAPRLSNDGISLEVKCVYCGKYFIPTNLMVHRVIQTLNGTKQGDSKMYCSDSCASVCPVYNQKKWPKSFKVATSREVTPFIRQRCFEEDNWECQMCGTHHKLHCHHILGATLYKLTANDIDNVITLCKKCHIEVHSKVGCRYVDLQCKD